MRNTLLAILVVLAVVFGLQNIHPVSLTFVVWQTDTALTYALLGAFVLGLAVGVLLVLPWGFRARRAARSASRQLALEEGGGWRDGPTSSTPKAPSEERPQASFPHPH